MTNYYSYTLFNNPISVTVQIIQGLHDVLNSTPVVDGISGSRNIANLFAVKELLNTHSSFLHSSFLRSTLTDMDISEVSFQRMMYFKLKLDFTPIPKANKIHPV